MKEIKFTLWPDLMAFSDKSAEEELRLPVKEISDFKVGKSWIPQSANLLKMNDGMVGNSWIFSPSANLLSDSVSELPEERGMPGLGGLID